MALTSCLELKFKGKIDYSGAGEMTITTEVPAQNPLNQDEPLPSPEQLKAETDSLAAEERKKAEASGVELTHCVIELVEGKKVQNTTLKFDNLEELNSYFNQDSQSKTEISLTTKGEKTTLSHKITVPKPEQQDPQQEAMMNALLDKAKVAISWTLPAEAGIISEGAVVSNDGKTVYWEMPLRELVEKGVDVFASFEGSVDTAAQEESSIPKIVSNASEPEQVGFTLSLFDVMLFMSILGAGLIVFLVILKIKVSRMEKK